MQQQLYHYYDREIGSFRNLSSAFTYGDLFPTMRYEDGKPYRKQVYTKREIVQIVDTYGLPQDWNRDGSLGPERYIEVQIWDDVIVKEWLA